MQETLFERLCVSFVAYVPEVGLWNLPVCVSVYTHYQLFNVWTSLHETWYAYHGTWAHVNGILHKSHPSVCVYMCIPLPLLGNGQAKRYRGNEYTRNNKIIVVRVVCYALRFVSKESWRLVLLRTSCLYIEFRSLHVTCNRHSMFTYKTEGDSEYMILASFDCLDFVTVQLCLSLNFFFLMVWDWVHLVLRPLFGLLYQPQMTDDGDCEAIGGMRIGRGNRRTGRKPAPVPLCPPDIPHDLTRVRTWAAAVGSQRLTKR
jgi:hypothetical protein